MNFFEFSARHPVIAGLLVQRLEPSKDERELGRCEQWLDDNWDFNQDKTDPRIWWADLSDQEAQGCTPMVFDADADRWIIGEEEQIPDKFFHPKEEVWH